MTVLWILQTNIIIMYNIVTKAIIFLHFFVQTDAQLSLVQKLTIINSKL